MTGLRRLGSFRGPPRKPLQVRAGSIESSTRIPIGRTRPLESERRRRNSHPAPLSSRLRERAHRTGSFTRSTRGANRWNAIDSNFSMDTATSPRESGAMTNDPLAADRQVQLLVLERTDRRSKMAQYCVLSVQEDSIWGRGFVGRVGRIGTRDRRRASTSTPTAARPANTCRHGWCGNSATDIASPRDQNCRSFHRTKRNLIVLTSRTAS